MDIQNIKKEVEKKIESSDNLKELESIFKDYLGKKGKVSSLFKNLKDLSEKEKKEKGKTINDIKDLLKEKFEKKKGVLKSKKDSFQEKGVDISQPGKRFIRGSLHPLTLTFREIEDIFKKMGFLTVEGPEIEDEWHHFDALNIPEDHPARDSWDTFWLKSKERLLMRAQTSPVQIRFMKENNPPLRIIAPGRTFRNESTDASHDIQFNQVEGLMVDKDISVANFRAIMGEFLKRFFGENAEIRLRPGFFPFTEPSFEIDMTCLACGGEGCSACSQTGWLEMMGAGMVHPNVYKSCGLVPDDWQGFAFGMGVDRLCMMKYRIGDIRLLYNGDLRFLKQF